MIKPEPVFAQDKISYNGQAVGLIVATSRDLANRAAKMVKVTYANEQKPVVNIMDAIEKAKADGSFEKQTFGTHSTKPVDDIKIVHTLKGSLSSGSQYHFHMEPQSCVCHPTEDGIDVYSSTQWMDFAQISICNVLAIPMNSVNMRVRRIGGGFGAKLTRSAYVATACALATWITKRPVRLILDLETNMRMLGKRLPTYIPYEVGFDEKGRIGKLDLDLISDAGFAPNEPGSFIGLIHVQSIYKARGWNISAHFVLTNTPANTYCRAPGSIKAQAALELIMDQIADHLKMDPITVREANLLEKGDQFVFTFVDPDPIYKGENLMPEMFQRMKKEADYESRCEAVKEFNKNNRWKKLGLGVVPLRFGIPYFGVRYPASVVVYRDGTVAVCHGGIEMGQGINTKAMQVVAEYLDVPMNKIKIKPSNNYVGANAFGSGASITSDMVCYATMRASKELQERLKKHKETMENKEASWEELIESAYRASVKLTADYQTAPGDNLEGYDVWGLNLTEVEIDVLTGEYKILRADIYEDTGNSLSPGVDLGQIEGAYMFGLGYWTTEKIVHDPEDGKLLTTGTWEYKVPEFKDLPEDFRVTLLNKAPNPIGVLRSKASGEPCANSSFAVVLAMRNAIASARADAGNTEWFQIDGPVTPEDVARLCLTQDSHFTV